MADTDNQDEAIRSFRDERDRAVHDLRIVQGKLETMNRRLEEAERGKSHFLSNVRSQVNNPVSSILALSILLLQGQDETPEALERKRLALLIRREALDLDFDMRNLLAAAELEAGEAVVTPVRIQTGRLLADCFEGLAHQVEEKRVRILLSDVPPETIFQDSGKFSLIVSNLLQNAVEYTRPATAVRISLTVEDGRVRLTVSDEGEGIPADRRVRIFDRFGTFEWDLSRSHQGVGIGLSVVQALVSLMGGGLRMESEPGRGTQVRVWIPELSKEAVYESSWGNDVLVLKEDPNAQEETF